LSKGNSTEECSLKNGNSNPNNGMFFWFSWRNNSYTFPLESLDRLPIESPIKIGEEGEMNDLERNGTAQISSKNLV
jgi:hypothetical protein